jgi:hypothetical protein
MGWRGQCELHDCYVLIAFAAGTVGPDDLAPIVYVLAARHLA